MTYYWAVAGACLALIGLIADSYIVTTLGLLLPVAVLVAWLWARYSLHALTYNRKLSSDRLYAGECVELELSLSNAKPLPVPWVFVEERLESGEVLDQTSYVPLDRRILVQDLERPDLGQEHLIRQTVSLGWYERVRWRYSLECPRRGQ